MDKTTPKRVKFELGDHVVVRDSHILEEIRGRRGYVAKIPQGVVKVPSRNGYYELRHHADGRIEFHYWVEFDDADAHQVGNVDAGMIPELDLLLCSKNSTTDELQGQDGP